MELIRKPIHYTQAGKNIFHQFYHDEDYNVPEQREDVGRIICGSAGLRSSDIRPVENGIRITGALDFHILYMTSSGDPKPAALEGKIPFEETVYTETDGNETFYLCNARVEFQYGHSGVEALVEYRPAAPVGRPHDDSGVVSDVDASLGEGRQIFRSEGPETLGTDFRGPVSSHEHVSETYADLGNHGMAAAVFGGCDFHG